MTENPDPSDERLVLKSQAGDRAAFEQLVRRTARSVFARLYLETGRADRAEDLAQETFLVAWRSIRQVTNPAGFRQWLFSVAKTVAVDASRHESRRKRDAGRREDSDALGTLADQRAATPLLELEREESRQRVLAIVRSLPEEYRLPLMLRYLNGSDYQSISRELGLTNGSLRGLLNRGMTLLREKSAGLDL